MLGTMHRWYVAAFSSDLCNIPTPVDPVLDGRVVQTHVKIDSLCVQRWPREQHPGKKSRHILHLLCNQGALRTVCLHQDTCLWLDYHLNHDIAKHGYCGAVKFSTGEWNCALLSSVMKVGSVCMGIMYAHVHVVDLVSVSFQSALTHYTQTPPHASWFGGPSVTTRGHIW